MILDQAHLSINLVKLFSYELFGIHSCFLVKNTILFINILPLMYEDEASFYSHFSLGIHPFGTSAVEQALCSVSKPWISGVSSGHSDNYPGKSSKTKYA